MTITRRIFVGGLAATAVMLSRPIGEHEMTLPTIVLTFDEWKEAATEAFPAMLTQGLPGTYFVTPSLIDTTSGPSLGTLLAMRQNGWEIGVYSGVNMPALEYESRVLANNKLVALKNDMWAKGIPVTSLAANQRDWNAKCRALADGIYDRVRVVSQYGTYQTLPLSDPLWVDKGATLSLSSTDTPASLSAQVDALIANGGVWIVVIHRVSADGQQPAYTVEKSTFTSFCSKIATEVQAGTLRCVRFCDL